MTSARPVAIPSARPVAIPSVLALREIRSDPLRVAMAGAVRSSSSTRRVASRATSSNRSSPSRSAHLVTSVPRAISAPRERADRAATRSATSSMPIRAALRATSTRKPGVWNGESWTSSIPLRKAASIRPSSSTMLAVRARIPSARRASSNLASSNLASLVPRESLPRRDLKTTVSSSSSRRWHSTWAKAVRPWPGRTA